ncbi:MAG: LamG domain-containing protein [Candidatus Pacebacteria bacterium]|nr:LamG domain-containing protein [Candidatus Paceibacterota bacterium]
MNKKLFLILILPVLALVGAWFLRGAFATSNPHQWTDGLMGYWPFDGQYTTSTNGTRDVSNNGNWGTFVGEVKPISGISGQALFFDGVDDYVNMGNNASLDITNAITLEAWIKPTETRWNWIVGKSWNAYFITAETNNTLRFRVYVDGDERNFYSIATIPLNTFTHVVATYSADTRTQKIYLNGLLSREQTLAGLNSYTIGTNASDARIGIYTTGEGAFKGAIDEVRIYSRALGADEVKQHYDQTKRNFVLNASNPNTWTTGLVGYWNFDGPNTTSTDGTRDASGNNNWGALANGVKPIPGISGQALYFDGSNDKVTVADADNLDFGTGDFSVECWFKAQNNTLTKTLVEKSNSQSLTDVNNMGWWLYVEAAGDIRFYIKDAANNYARPITAPIYEDDIWHHVVAKRESNLLSIWVDGISKATANSANVTGTLNNTFAVGIGQSVTESIRVMLGNIDEVRLYNRALSADEIKQHYDQTKRNFIIDSSNPHTWTDGLMGYWPFDGQYTTSTNGTRDVSNNGNWGTFSGGVKPTAGISGQALFFDGVNDYVDVGSGASLDISGSFSLEAWIKPNVVLSTMSSYAMIIGRVGSLNNTGYYLTNVGNAGTANDGKLYIGFYDTTDHLGRVVVVTRANIVGVNEWAHLVGTYDKDGKTLKIYLNGILNNTANQASSYDVGLADKSCKIGGLGTSNWWNGFIDEVRIYSRALSADEVKQHYEQTRRNIGL